MKCIKEGILQQYIDNEIQEPQLSEVEEHLQKCADCKQRFDEQKMASQFVVSELSKLTENQTGIPSFEFPKKKKNIYRRLFYSLAAASVIFLGIYLFKEESYQNKIEETPIVITDFEFDANKSITEQDFEITIISENEN